MTESSTTDRRAPGMRSPRVEIEYCTGCRWGLRAGWLAQELLTTFEAELAEVALVPGRRSGIFVVRLDGEPIFDRAEAGRFPELRELKQRVRDRIAPGRDLGHSEGHSEGHLEGHLEAHSEGGSKRHSAGHPERGTAAADDRAGDR